MFEGKFTELPDIGYADLITDLRFLPQSHDLVASAFSNQVFLYEYGEGGYYKKAAELTTDSPPLCMEFTSNKSNFMGFLDGSVKVVDYENLKFLPTGIMKTSSHEVGQGINNLCNVNGSDHNIASSSFDGNFTVLDTRTLVQVFNRKFSKKIIKMESSSQHLIVAFTDREVNIFDSRNWNEPYQVRECGLKYQVSDLKCSPKNEIYATSSVDGRVAIEYIDPSTEYQLKKFAFKCHRKVGDQGDALVHPVNSIAFHPSYGTLFTAGSDGTICLWDLSKRKRMRQYNKLNGSVSESITKIAVSDDGMFLAAGTGQDAFKNVSSLYENSTSLKSCIYVKSLSEAECNPRS